MSKRDKINKWVTENYEWFIGEIEENICKGKMQDYSGDLAVHVIEDLYRLDEAKIDQMLNDDKLGWYLLVGAGRQLRSSTSPFYRKYRKVKFELRENGLPNSDSNIFERPDEPYDDELYECFTEAYNELDWYLKAIMDKYFYEGMNLLELHKYYNISKTHLIKDMNTAINIIREKCKEC